MMDTRLKKSTAFHPQTDGQTEVVNKTMIQLLRGYCSKHPKLWDEHLCYVQHAYNKALLHRDLLLRLVLVSYQGLLWILSLVEIPWLMDTVMWTRQLGSLNRSKRSTRQYRNNWKRAKPNTRLGMK